jgi:hypothetical protein
MTHKIVHKNCAPYLHDVIKFVSSASSRSTQVHVTYFITFVVDAPKSYFFCKIKSVTYRRLIMYYPSLILMSLIWYIWRLLQRCRDCPINSNNNNSTLQLFLFKLYYQGISINILLRITGVFITWPRFISKNAEWPHLFANLLHFMQINCIALVFFCCTCRWVILCASWFLCSARRVSHEVLVRYSSSSHLIAWGVPAAQTVAVLAFRLVDADELTGGSTTSF